MALRIAGLDVVRLLGEHGVELGRGLGRCGGSGRLSRLGWGCCLLAATGGQEQSNCAPALSMHDQSPRDARRTPATGALLCFPPETERTLARATAHAKRGPGYPRTTGHGAVHGSAANRCSKTAALSALNATSLRGSTPRRR